MSFLPWVAGVGVLLLTMALASGFVSRLPLTPAVLYLAVGAAVGPGGLGWLPVDFVRDAAKLELITGAAIAVSLFLAGLKLRRPPRDALWHPAYLLVGPVMLLTIGAVALFAWAFLGLSPASGLLLGAILAPTDPVLASEVALDRSSDRDPLRYALTAESGLNDGAALPLVAVALLVVEHGLAPRAVGSVLLSKLVWAIPVGMVIGFLTGRLLGHAAIALRARHREANGPNDFLALAIIALSFAAAEAIGASGFLAVFAAGVGLRSAEVTVVQNDPHPEHPATDQGEHAPAEELAAEQRISASTMAHPAVAAGVVVTDSMSFGETLERGLEIALVLLVGATVATTWSAQGLLVAMALFLFVRPAACELCLLPTSLDRTQRRLVGFLGIRGIGSVYYLAYAVAHALPPALAAQLTGITLTVVAASVMLHGVTATPLVNRYRERRSGQETGRGGRHDTLEPQ